MVLLKDRAMHEMRLPLSLCLVGANPTTRAVLAS